MAESPILKEFASVWHEMGLTDELRKTRRETIQLHLTNLLREIADEEINLKKKLVTSVAASERELEDLCQTLSLPVDLVSKYVLNLCTCVKALKSVPKVSSVHISPAIFRTFSV